MSHRALVEAGRDPWANQDCVGDRRDEGLRRILPTERRGCHDHWVATPFLDEVEDARHMRANITPADRQRDVAHVHLKQGNRRIVEHDPDARAMSSATQGEQ